METNDKVMDMDLWNKIIDDHNAKLDEKRGVEVPAPRPGEGGMIEFPLCFRTLTDDLIRIFASCIGDPNPLWYNEEYAKKTKWGGVIAPPLAEVMVAECSYTPPPPPLPGVLPLNCGSKREYFKPIRPGDRFDAVDVFLGVIEKTKPGTERRQFLYQTERKFINQRGEHACSVTSSIIVQIPYPERAAKQDKGEIDFSNFKRHYFTEEEMNEIYASYDDCVDGKYRRGAEIRYWEDVEIGEELHPLIKGPYDISDGASFYGITGMAAAFASKWATMRAFREGLRPDVETGALHAGIDWHLHDGTARIAGVPFAPIFGTHVESGFGHLITDWMGDDGELCSSDTQVRGMTYVGEAYWVKGKVTDKYEKDGQYYVAISCEIVNYVTGKVNATNKSVVRLQSKQ